MSRSKHFKLAGLISLCISCLAVWLGGCSEKGGGDLEANQPPDTHISFGPAENAQTYFKVPCFWFGTDPDGTVERYQIATISDLNLSELTEAQLDSLSKAIFVSHPYITTTATETTFVLEADSWCDTCGTPGTAQIATSYWGVFVRAVDNEGLMDPNPERSFFQATNLVPKARITVPYKPYGRNVTLPAKTYVEWGGVDEDGEVSGMQYKYIIAPVLKDSYEGPPQRPPDLPPFDHVYTEAKMPYAVTPTGYWSDWVPADCTDVKDIDLSQFMSGEGFDYFARVCVTCKDEGGAVLPEELFGEIYNADANWIMISVIAEGGGVVTEIDGGPLGRRNSSDQTGPIGYMTNVAGLFSGTRVSFRFWGREIRDQGKMAKEYRYYYDDPEDPRTSTWNYWTSVEPIRDTGHEPPEWVVRYPPDGKTFVPSLGPHVFTVELRDLTRAVTHCEFRVEVLNGPVGKPDKLVYLVDDDAAEWLSPTYRWYEQGSDSLWAAILGPYNYEVFDTGKTFTREVSVRRVADASTVIWNVDQDDVRPTCQLTLVCYERGNYLDSYVKVGGNLIIIGRDPIFACQFWPDQTPYIDLRGEKTSMDFSPVLNRADSTYMYNFNWDIFGIRRMEIANPDVPTNELYPCDPDFEPIHSKSLEGMEGWDGTFYNPFYITEVRPDSGGVWPNVSMSVPVRKIYTTVPVDEWGNQLEPDCEARCIGVYVPAHDGRGHAAYIGIPPWFFDHDQVKALIQKLLDEFGEPRKAF